MKKAYKPRTLKGAAKRVSQLTNALKQANDTVTQLNTDRVSLAKLSAKGPAFYNPMEIFAAEKIRDEILARIGMNPDGSPKTR